jgi:hypothetical protein
MVKEPIIGPDTFSSRHLLLYYDLGWMFLVPDQIFHPERWKNKQVVNIHQQLATIVADISQQAKEKGEPAQNRG